MPDFTFSNPYGFLIAFIPALLNLGIVFYIYRKLPEYRLTNVFALLSFALACWQINDSLTRVSVSAQVTNMWDNVFCIAWIFVGPLCLHFALLYSSILKNGSSRTALFLLYAPAVTFMLLYQAQVYPHEFIYHEFWGWVNYHDKHWIDKTQIFWISALVTAATVIIFYNAYSVRKDVMLKKQTLLIASGIGIPTLAGIIGQVIMPLLMEKPAVPVASTFMTFFSLATVVSLSRYRLFNAADIMNDERLIEDIPVIIFSISEKMRLTYVNNHGAEVLGFKINEIGLHPVNKLLVFGSTEHENKFFESFKQSLAGATINHFESSLLTPGGKIHIIISSKPIKNNNRVEGVLMAVRDVTALKQSSELITQKEALLADAQRISHIGSWEWILKENKIIWSNELYRIYGYEPGTLPLSFNSIIDLSHPEDKELVEKEIGNSFVTKEPFSFYARIIKKDNSIVRLHVRGQVHVDAESNPIKISGTSQDVTELKEKEEKLEIQYEELQKINQELDKFVYSVSHDLRAPLLSMRGVVDITTDITEEEITVEHMEMLKTSISRMDKFIADILDYSRNARGEIKVKPVDFNEIIRNKIDELKHMTAEGRSVEILPEVKSAGNFFSDEGRINIILNNLVSNSIRYSNPQESNPFVRVRVDSNQSTATIIVEDNGAGISKENHEKIFEMFYRVSNNSVGSGLGLYIVKEAVEKLQGKIRLNSDPGKGTKITIELPNLFYQ